MPIIIPSKNLYEKDNSKLVDNQVNSLEANITAVYNSREENSSIYSNTTDSFNVDEIKTPPTGTNVGTKAWEPSDRAYANAFVYVDYNCNYMQLPHFDIPRFGDDREILGFHGTIEDNPDWYSYEIRYYKHTGKVNATIVYGDLVLYDGTPEPQYLNNATFSIDRGSIVIDKTEEKTLEELELPKQSEKFTYYVEGSDIGNPVGAVAEITAQTGDMGTLEKTFGDVERAEEPTKLTVGGTATTIIEQEQIILKAGQTVYNNGNVLEKGNFLKTQNVECEYIKYEPIQLDIYVKGDKITIDLKEGTFRLGETTNQVKPFRLEGNELVQENNYCFVNEQDFSKKSTIKKLQKMSSSTSGVSYLIQSSALLTVGLNIYYKGESAIVLEEDIEPKQYYIRVIGDGEFYRAFEDNKIIQAGWGDKVEVYNKTSSLVKILTQILNSYSKGKETATIRCSISDYYDKNGNLRICDKKVTPAYDIAEVDVSGGDYVEVTLTLKSPCKNNVYVVYELDGEQKIAEILSGNTIFSFVYDARGQFRLLEVYWLKMTFDLYDKVIPMTYGANGVDKPLSKYKDGSAKVFQVLGMRPIYDGAVWQELTLQETSQ